MSEKRLKKSYKGLFLEESYYLYCKRHSLDITFDDFFDKSQLPWRDQLLVLSPLKVPLWYVHVSGLKAHYSIDQHVEGFW
mgnify:CR=1 FL=1